MAELKKLSEALNDPDAHPQVVVMFVDMVDSTPLKEKTPEANWLSTYGWFYETVSGPIIQAGGQIVKFTGDGALAVFTDDKAVDAINASIKVQESITEGVDNRRVEITCSIGIATGEAVRFATPGDKPTADYIGSTVDRAARLCSVASPMAIFMDETTRLSTIATRITSQIGNITRPRRPANEYIGSEQTIALKGFGRPVTYYEILWAMQRYGVKSEAVSQLERERMSLPVPTDTGVEERARASSGTIRSWNNVATRGFIESGSEELYFDMRDLVKSSEHIIPGNKVFFVPRPGPRPEGRRTASCVVAKGQTLTGRLTIPLGREFGFVRVTDAKGTTLDLYVYLGRGAGGFHTGDEILFMVDENNLGPMGTNAYFAKNKVDPEINVTDSTPV